MNDLAAQLALDNSAMREIVSASVVKVRKTPE
jgi:hypothetical protein